MKIAKKRTKKYHAKPISLIGGLSRFAAAHARYEDNQPISADQNGDIALNYWLSFQELTKGSASESAWSAVVCSLNVGMVLCEFGIGSEYIENFNLALEGAFRAKIRSEKSGNFRLNGDGISRITLALQIHEEQMRIANKSEITKALNTVQERIDAGNVFKINQK